MKIALQVNRLSGEAVVRWKQVEDFFSTATSNFSAATQDFKNTSSQAMQSAIAASASEWLQAHPVLFRILSSIIWSIDHPIISFLFVVLTVAITFSIIKALNRLLEMVGLSLLQAPFKLIKTGLKLSWLGGLGVQQKFNNKNIANKHADIITPQNSQQRLAEISLKVQLLQKEQNELLQEAANILDLHKN